MVKNNKLGRGLASIFGENHYNSAAELVYLDLQNIIPNKDQPRKRFSQHELEELTESIKEKGVLSPILVNKLAENSYMIIAGERRFRAAKSAGLDKIPAIIKNLDPQEILEIALIENIQRHDLHSLEECRAYEYLIKTYSYSHEQLAKRLGKSRSHITNSLRVLSLTEKVHNLLEDGKLKLGHAKLLVSLDNPEEVADKIVGEGMSVREAERFIASQKQAKDVTKSNEKANFLKSQDLKSMETILSKKLGFPVKIKAKSNRTGSVSLNYKNLTHLHNIISLLGQN